jgi:hypothetical protein
MKRPKNFRKIDKVRIGYKSNTYVLGVYSYNHSNADTDYIFIRTLNTTTNLIFSDEFILMAEIHWPDLSLKLHKVRRGDVTHSSGELGRKQIAKENVLTLDSFIEYFKTNIINEFAPILYK